MAKLVNILSFGNEPIAEVDCDNTKIYLFPPNLDDFGFFEKIESNSVATKFKLLLPHISSSNNPTEPDYKRHPVSKDFIDGLDKESLKKIAEVYVNTNIIKNLRVDSSSNPTIRKSNESAFDYLNRIINNYIKEFTDARLKAQKDIFESVKLSSNILGDTLDQYKNLQIHAEQLKAPSKQLISNIKLDNSVQKQLDITAEMTAQSADLLKKLSDASTEFLEKFEKSNKDNNKAINIQIWVALIALLISIILSSASLYYAIESFKENKSSNKNEASQIKLMKKNMDELSQIKNENLSLTKEVITLKNNSQTNQNEIKALKDTIITEKRID